MKQTVTRVGVLCFLGLGAVAYAQQGGKVGINTTTSQATLQVKSQTGTDATTINFELENANGTKMVTVLDNGKVGISTPEEQIADALLTLTRIATNMPDKTCIFQIRDSRYTVDDNLLSNAISFVDKNLKGYGIIGETSRAGKRFGLSTYDAYDAYLGTGSLNYLPDGSASGYVSSSFLYVSTTDDNDRRFRVEVNNGSNTNTATKEEFIINSKGNVYIGSELPLNTTISEKLEVAGNIKSTSLAGAGDRPVVADANSVLKVGTSTTLPAVVIGSTPDMPCDASNRGKMNFVPNDNGNDVFGICLRNADGNHYWGYMVGGNNPTNGIQAFGSGL